MAEFEETVKLVDGAYKNILEKFNPCARQLISAGKTYLKALHGAVAASKGYIDAISRLARHAHQATWGGCTDIGTALMQLVDVQKEIEAQQMNILKAFYVDLLVPLESNIEKDAKVVASEQKKFLQQHKAHQESYLKVAAVVKKQRKKRSHRGSNLEKEIKQMQALEEEKGKLDGFCESSLKQAITQERRRFGFVLERQCSLAKHYLAFHAKGHALLQHNVENWQEIVRTREVLPESIGKIFNGAPELRLPLHHGSEYASSGILSDPESTRLSSTYGSAFVRKTRSIDASCVDLRSLADDAYPRPLSRAKSDFNLASSSASIDSAEYVSPMGQKNSLEPPKMEPRERSRVRALYSYLSNGEHQLSFHEGDLIELVGNRNKGWHYGVNLRNHRCGWFPIAYTEPQEADVSDFDSFVSGSDSSNAAPSSSSESSSGSTGVARRWRPKSGDAGSYDCVGLPSTPAPRRPLSSFADTYLFRRQSPSPVREAISTESPLLYRGGGLQSPLLCPAYGSGYSPASPDPAAGAPAGTNAANPASSSSSTTSPATIHPLHHHPPSFLRPPRRSLTSPFPFPLPPPRLPPSASLHSSSDSGFCNDSGSQQGGVGGQALPTEEERAEESKGSGDDGGMGRGTELEETEEDEASRDDASPDVKLKKATTDDRSAPTVA